MDGGSLEVVYLKDNKLYQVLITKEQKFLLERFIGSLFDENKIKVWHEPICEVKLEGWSNDDLKR
jgi:hypothetical protein